MRHFSVFPDFPFRNSAPGAIRDTGTRAISSQIPGFPDFPDSETLPPKPCGCAMVDPAGYLEAMRGKGVYFFAQAGHLYWHAPAQLSPEVASHGKAIKAELLALVSDETQEALCTLADPEEAEYLQEERAGVLEFEGGLIRLEAELRAGVDRNKMEAA